MSCRFLSVENVSLCDFFSARRAFFKNISTFDASLVLLSTYRSLSLDSCLPRLSLLCRLALCSSNGDSRPAFSLSLRSRVIFAFFLSLHWRSGRWGYCSDFTCRVSDQSRVVFGICSGSYLPSDIICAYAVNELTEDSLYIPLLFLFPYDLDFFLS